MYTKKVLTLLYTLVKMIFNIFQDIFKISIYFILYIAKLKIL